MRILVDTDVLLDVALARADFVEHSAGVLRWCEESGEGAIAWHSIANMSYILKNNGRPFLDGLLKVVTVAEVGHDAAAYALQLKFPDLEDAMQVAAARAWVADQIVTRNLKHYRRSPIVAVSPKEFLRRLGAKA